MDNKFYDKIYSDGGHNGIYDMHYSEIPYYPLWKYIIEQWIAPHQYLRILDMGCGPGQFAQMLQDTVGDKAFYIGVDFSKEAISKARRTVSHPYYSNFHVCDLTVTIPFRNLFDVFVCLETLEHLPRKYDIELMKKIPKKKRVILSVPSYDSEGHYRTFNGIDDIRKRYGAVLHIESSFILKLSVTNQITAINGYTI